LIAAIPATEAQATHTCVLHGSLELAGAGRCPRCGLALEPTDPLLEENPRAATGDARRLGLAVALTVIVLAVGIAGRVPWGETGVLLSPRLAGAIQVLVAAPVVLGCGWPWLAGLALAVRRRRVGPLTPLALGIVLAWLHSAAAAGFPEWFTIADADGEIGRHFDVSALAVTLALFAQRYARMARVQAGEPIRELQRAARGIAETASADDSAKDEARLLDHVVARAAHARRAGGAAQRLTERGAVWLAVVVLAAAVLAGVGWTVWGPQPRLARALPFVVSVLLVGSPLALGLAVPQALRSVISGAVGRGILFRDADSIDKLRQADTLVVNLHGTLTQGAPYLVSVLLTSHRGPRFDERELLRLAAAVARADTHPMARAIAAAADQQELTRAHASDVVGVPGRGLEAAVEGHRVAIGSRRWLEELGVDPGAAESWVEELGRESQSVVWAAVDGRAAGLLALADPIRPDAAAGVNALRDEGLEVRLATADGAATARAVAARVGIEQLDSDVPAEERGRVVERLQGWERRVALVGDGTRDAVALARADVGIVAGAATPETVDRGGVALSEADLGAIVAARRLARVFGETTRRDLVGLALFHLLGLPLAAGAIVPWTGFWLPPAAAILASTAALAAVTADARRVAQPRD